MLLKTPGITTVKTGGIGNYMGVSLWGSSANQVNVYVNGILQNQAANGAAFLSDIDPAQIEEIEVYKGMAPDFLEGSPMGGTINIITRQGQKGTLVQGDIGAGSFNNYKANASVQLGGEAVNSFFHAGWDQGVNDYEYLDDLGLESGKSEDDLTRRVLLHNDHRLLSLHSVTSVYTSGTRSLVIDAGYSDLEKMYPASGLRVDSNVGARRNSAKANVQLNYRDNGPRNTISGRLYFNIVKDEYIDSAGYVGDGYDLDKDNFYTAGAVIWNRYQLNKKLRLSGQGSYSTNIHQFADKLNNVTYPELYRFSGEVKLAPDYTFNIKSRFKTQLTVTNYLEEYYSGVRYSQFNDVLPRSIQNTLWSLYGEYQYTPAANMETYILAGKGYRMPTFYERFGDRGSIKGNANILPEENITFSTGFIYHLPHLEITTRYYHISGNKTITTSQNSQNTIVYQNTDATQINGEEISLKIFESGIFSTLVNLTHQTPINRSLATDGAYRDNRFLPYRPIILLHISQDLYWKGFHFNAASTLRGLTFYNPSNTPAIQDLYSENTNYHLQHNTRLSYSFHKLQTTLSLNNITNENLYDVFGSPLPGRNFKATIQLHL